MSDAGDLFATLEKMSRGMAMRFIIVRHGGQTARVDITGCQWCPPEGQAICSLCGSKADRARKALRASLADGIGA